MIDAFKKPIYWFIDQHVLKDILDKRKEKLVKQAASIGDTVYAIEVEDLPDEVDLASSESDQSMNMRLRGRERILIKKIDKALEKIANGTYGICEECDEDIPIRRLEARPVTDLCIRCKEEQEHVEKSFADD